MRPDSLHGARRHHVRVTSVSPARLAVLILACAAAALGGQVAQPARRDTGDAAARALIARHKAAIGNDAIKTPAYTYAVSEIDVEPGRTVRNETWSGPGRFLMRATVPGLGSTEMGFDGVVGWAKTPYTGITPLDGPELKMLVSAMSQQELMDSVFKSRSVAPSEQLDGRTVNPVHFELNNGVRGILYFDVETGVMAGSRAVAIGDEPADTGTVTLVGEYRKFDGVSHATRYVARGPGLEIVTRVTHVEHKAIPDSIFRAPAELKSAGARKP